jgi:hypothetical protein
MDLIEELANNLRAVDSQHDSDDRHLKHEKIAHRGILESGRCLETKFLNSNPQNHKCRRQALFAGFPLVLSACPLELACPYSFIRWKPKEFGRMCGGVGSVSVS